jgi:hypothetical protein
VAAGALLACVVQQPLSDILPDRLGAGQPDRIGLLYHDGATAAATGDPQHVSLDVAEPLFVDRVAGRSGVGGSIVSIGVQIWL